MKPHFFALSAAALICSACAMAGSTDAPGPDDLKHRLAGYYEPVRAPAAKPAVPATPLPLALENLGNWAAAQQCVPEAARESLSRNGFVVTDALRSDKVEEFYKAVTRQGLPVFVTSDSLLHLYHIQFDETLRRIEETKFSDDLLALTGAMEAESVRAWQALPENGREAAAAQLCAGFFAVAEKLLDDKAKMPELPAVQDEINLIAAHTGFAASPLFKYKEDYSQYVPRGHYTRSEELGRYFKAMLWYGRMAFLIKGKTEAMPDALVSDEEARTQTLAAFQIAGMLDALTLPDGRKAMDVWRRIYAVTAYYVGFSDDLTAAEYGAAFASLPMDKTLSPAAMIQTRWLELQKALAALRAPAIYGGTGDVQVSLPAAPTEAELDKALAPTQGMRFMGQRYVPDSYIMGRLVFPTVGKFTGEGTPFTRVQSQAGPIRGFPRGLDVMAVLGSARARELIHQMHDDTYEGYDAEFVKLRNLFAAVPAGDWNRNMYWSWLSCLRALLAPTPDGYPTFMRSAAWTDKQLNASLGSWAQLRHDTILYAKQSHTMVAAAMPLRPKMVEGYVEPVPEFYARLLALTRMSLKGLDDMQVLDDAGRNRLKALDGVLQRLLDISARELGNENLGKADYDFIRTFAAQLEHAVAGVNSLGLETTIIADVHTDGNSGKALEEGTGELRAIAVAYPMPDGATVLGFGPVFSYCEFKQPMADRLTDEAWKAMLKGPNTPKPATDQWPSGN